MKQVADIQHSAILHPYFNLICNYGILLMAIKLHITVKLGCTSALLSTPAMRFMPSDVPTRHCFFSQEFFLLLTCICILFPLVGDYIIIIIILAVTRSRTG